MNENHNPRDLPVQVASLSSSERSSPISTELWRRLSSNIAGDQEVREIASIPALHEEVKAVAAMLEARAKGCGPEAVRLALQPLVLLFGNSEAARSPAFWAAYIDALADVPADPLAEAIRDYVRKADSEFFPKPGPLRALALRRAEGIIKAADRARRAARYDPAPPIDRGTVEERRALVESLRIKPVPRGPSDDGSVF